MIAFFPELYPDELLYSALARYFDRSGYGIYRAGAENLFENRLVKPDILFVNKLRPELIDILTRQMPWEQVISEHTMYPYFGRFLPHERRRKAFQSLVSMSGNHKNLLQMPNRGDADRQYLRYCPECSRRDREIYGETYWHRVHQMRGIDICPKHGCKLIDSDVALLSKTSPGFFSAECSILEQEAQEKDNKLELKLARYVSELMELPVADVDVSYHRFLHEKMAGGKYTSPRGEQKRVSILFDDFITYYCELDDNPISELWQLKKIVDGKTYRMKEIAMLAMFIGLSPAELAAMKMPEELHRDAFDRKVKELHEQGLKYPRIAEIMDASVNVVKPVGENLYGKYTKGRTENNGGIRSRDWDEYDRNLLPRIQMAITEIRGGGDERPKRITVNAVAAYLGVSDRWFDKCRLCLEALKPHLESWEEFWAREMVYFYEKLRQNGTTITVTKITKMTNTRRRNLRRGLPYLERYTDNVTAEIIRQMIE